MKLISIFVYFNFKIFVKLFFKIAYNKSCFFLRLEEFAEIVKSSDPYNVLHFCVRFRQQTLKNRRDQAIINEASKREKKAVSPQNQMYHSVAILI